MNPKQAEDSPEKATDRREPLRIPLPSLLEGRSEVILVHNGEDYRLRVTSRGKLILTK